MSFRQMSVCRSDTPRVDSGREPLTSRFVSYLRISTNSQGRSRLGLEAQRQAVAAHVAQAAVVFCDLSTVPAGAVGEFLVTQMAAVAQLEAGLGSPHELSEAAR